MQNSAPQLFGRFIDDIRVHHPEITVTFSFEYGKATMTVASKLNDMKQVTINTKYTGDIVYDTAAYEELFDMTINYLNNK